MLLNSYHQSWEDFLTVEIRELLKNIESQIGDDFTPDSQNVLRFLKLDKNNIKVVILGQDPYHAVDKFNHKVANGRAFEPDNLLNWHQKFRQVSLKNIVRLIHKTYNDIDDYNDIWKYPDIVKAIDNHQFALKQPPEFFDSIEKQGVLLINTAFTTKLHLANQHKQIWQPFTIALLKYLNNQDIYWFLWGKNSLNYAKYIEGKKIISNHPMMCSSKYTQDFLKSNCFAVTKDIINWLG